MSATKTEFQRDKELVKWWVSVVKDDRFDKIMVFIRSCLSEQWLDQSQMQGARTVLETMTELVEPAPNPSKIPGPGLIHWSESDLATHKPLEEKKAKK